MGASTFETKSSGKTARHAFEAAVSRARYEYGHGGYTGTIAEKNSYKVITLPSGVDPSDEASRLLRAGDPRIDDKWGPAGCFDLGPNKDDPSLHDFYFFGWASD